MASRRSILGFALCAALVYAGVDWVESHVDIVTLRVSGNHDHYPRLFIVDDPPGAWIRAERPDRFWLASLRANPSVVVRRGDRDVAYRAEEWNGQASREKVDALFREKYGVIDWISGVVWRRDAVPIRLEPVDY